MHDKVLERALSRYQALVKAASGIPVVLDETPVNVSVVLPTEYSTHHIYEHC
jgi:hypothetical protein